MPATYSHSAPTTVHLMLWLLLLLTQKYLGEFYNKEKLIDTLNSEHLRLSYGCGVVCSLVGNIRMEVNVSKPILKTATDS